MKRLLLLLLACAGLWLAACSSSINASSTSLADQLIAPGGVSTLLDRPRIAAAIAEGRCAMIGLAYDLAVGRARVIEVIGNVES